jgi:branched-chain amino acid transport system substrate-binding protein
MDLSDRPGRRPRLTRREFLVAGSAAALAAACAPAGQGGVGAPTGATAAPTAAAATATPAAPLKIGMLLPFTQVYAELGNSQKRAAELYMKQAGGKLASRPVQFIYEDEASGDTKIAVTKTQKFIDQDQADLMMGIIATPNVYAIRNTVDAAKFIYIGTNAGGNAMTRATANCTPACISKYVFRTSFSAWQVSEPLGEWVSKKGEKEFFLCYSNYAFGTESANAFVEGLGKNGGKDTGKNTPALGNTDWLPVVTAIKGQPTKNVFSFFSGTDAIGYVRAWDQLGMRAAGYKMYGAGFLTEQDVLKEVKTQALGAITSLFWSVELDNAENKAFVDAYRKEYSLLPDVFAVQMWDGMKALDEGLKKTGGNTKDKDALIAALEGVSFKSPRGDFSFDKTTHNVVHDIYIREVKQSGNDVVNSIVDKFGKVTDPGK